MAANATSFGPGNVAALKHGGRSSKVRESYRKALLGEMRGYVEALLPDLDPASALLLDLLAAALCDTRQLDEWINRMGGPLSAKGQVYKAVDIRRARERDALALMDRLGVGPRARTQILGGMVAADGLAGQLARRRLELTTKPTNTP